MLGVTQHNRTSELGLDPPVKQSQGWKQVVCNPGRSSLAAPGRRHHPTIRSSPCGFHCCPFCSLGEWAVPLGGRSRAAVGKWQLALPEARAHGWFKHFPGPQLPPPQCKIGKLSGAGSWRASERGGPRWGQQLHLTDARQRPHPQGPGEVGRSSQSPVP